MVIISVIFRMRQKIKFKGRFLKILWVLVILLNISGCAIQDVIQEKLYYAAPTLIPNTQLQMKTAGFWISRHPFPNKVILTPEEIRVLNNRTENELKLITDITKIKSLYSGKELVSALRKPLNYVQQEKLYQADGKKADLKFYHRIEEGMGLGIAQNGSEVKYGFIVHYADQRVLPTEEGLYAQQGDIDFDELQNSSFDVGTPLTVLHTSPDGKWCYVVSPSSSGWVRTDEVALCNREEFNRYLKQTDFVVVISPKADIFLNPVLTDYYDYVRMGTRFPAIKNTESSIVEVIVPFRLSDGSLSQKTAYLHREDVNFGYLSYTPRTIIEQGFRLINTPYGWGGMYGEQDCSEFLQEIFATVGILLPRNSSVQSKVGVLVGEFDKKSSGEERLRLLSEKAVGGITVLYLKGHIMLFLGIVDGKPYAIHAIWAYRQHSGFEKDYIRVINRVAVTDLSLSKGSPKGSLMERLVTVRKIDKI